MDFYLDGKSAPSTYFKTKSNAKQLLFIPSDEVNTAAEQLDLSSFFSVTSPHPNAKDSFSRFESHIGLDTMAIYIPAFEKGDKRWTHIVTYRTQDTLIFVYEPHAVMEKMLQLMRRPENAEKELGDIFYSFLDLLTCTDSFFLQTMEEEIVSLEDTLVADPEKKDYVLEISSLRKKLLSWKHYYESLFESLVDLEENENGFYSKYQLRHLHLVTNRCDRLSRAVIGLREILTQAREAYQSQIDIQLGKSSRFFAVLSAFFMPLTLITGWYGMNLIMPEHNAPHAYIIVIVVSILIVILDLIIFKKRKWI